MRFLRDLFILKYQDAKLFVLDVTSIEEDLKPEIEIEWMPLQWMYFEEYCKAKLTFFLWIILED